MRALITGITGFAGSHLAEYLLGKDFEVFGTTRWRSKTENIDHIRDRLKLIEMDIRDSYSVERAIKESSPDFIFHLAAQSFVHASWHAPQETLTTNIVGTVNLLEAARRFGGNARIQLAGSSEEYGLVYPEEIPIKETNPLRPLSPYGVSKVAEDRLGFQYYKSYGLPIVVTRAFNHEGPRRGDVFVTSTFSKQVAEIEKGLKKPVLHVGNLDAKRDFTDVRDMVKAYHLALEKCRAGDVYNICSGKAIPMKEIISILTEMTPVKNMEISQDPTRMRPSDVPVLEGDCTKFKKETGWEPTIPFRKTMEDLLNYWRARV
jgi:GDP-4-dehydro-6-deoxy-D-mannose reductase